MIERVARALAEHVGCPWAEVPDKDAALGAARVAVAAMREPTGAMFDAGREADARFLHNATSVWHAMIDAALAEGK